MPVRLDASVMARPRTDAAAVIVPDRHEDDVVGFCRLALAAEEALLGGP
jgi:hypothetical protein